MKKYERDLKVQALNARKAHLTDSIEKLTQELDEDINEINRVADEINQLLAEEIEG